MKAKNFTFPSAAEGQAEAVVASAEVEELVRSFDRERQEFYREKSRFEKELLVKEGQIEMLQRMLTGRIGGEPALSYQFLESLLLEKDLQANQLLERIGELGRQLSSRAEELRAAKTETNRLENLNESLLHQIYLLEREQANNKTTQQFYDRHRPNKPTTPTARNWNYDKDPYDKQPYDKDLLRYPGLCDLQQRLETLKSNRIELEDRKRIKSELNYTQPDRFGSYKPSKF